MEAVQSSVLCRLFLPLWQWLKDKYEYSLLARIIRGIARGWSVGCSGSVLIGFITREGCLSKAWPKSVLCRVLTFLLSIPTILLQKLYGRFERVFEGSIFCRLCFAVVEQTPLAVAWLMLIIMVIPFKYWNNAYSFAGFILCFLLAICSGTRKKSWRLDVAYLGPWLVAFGAMILVAWPLSAYSSLSFRFLPYYITCLLCLIVLVSTIKTKDQLRRLLAFSSIALLVMSLAGMYQRAQGILLNPSYVDVNINKGMPGRVWSFYENPNTFAEVLLLLLPLAVAYMLCAKGWLGRIVGFVCTGAGCVAMAMTYSRASWVGLVVAAAVFVILWNKKLIPVGILAAFLALGCLPDTVFHRILTIFNTSDTSTTSRFPLYQAAAEFLQKRPILGAGLGSDAVREAINDLNLFHGKDTFVHCHNIYLQVWCETGLVGLISFVGGVLWSFKKGCRAIKNTACSRVTRMTVVGGGAALLGTMVCGIADYIWNYPRVMLIFWFVCALVLAAVQVAAKETENPKQLP